MIDIKLIRENPEMVRQNMRNKFQDNKVELVDKVLALDSENRTIKTEVEALRAERNKSSKLIGGLMAQGKKDEAEAMKTRTSELGGKIDELSARENEVEEEIKTIMMRIPNIIDKSVPIGKDDSENVERERFGDPVIPDFEVPYHTDIMERLHGIDLDAARRVAPSIKRFYAFSYYRRCHFFKRQTFGYNAINRFRSHFVYIGSFCVTSKISPVKR